MEERSRGIERRRIARAQLAVDLNQSFLWGLHGITAQRVRNHIADIVALREEDMDFSDARIQDLGELIGGNLGISFEQHLAGVGVDHIGSSKGAFQISDIGFDLGDLRLVNFLQNRRRNLAAGMGDLIPGPVLDAVGNLDAEQVGRALHAGLDRPVILLVVQRDLVNGIESAKDVFIRT